MRQIGNGKKNSLQGLLFFLNNGIQVLQLLRDLFHFANKIGGVLPLPFSLTHVIRNFLLESTQFLPFLQGFSSLPVDEGKWVKIDILAPQADSFLDFLQMFPQVLGV